MLGSRPVNARRLPAILEAQDSKRDEAGQHGEPPVERVGDAAVHILRLRVLLLHRLGLNH